MNSRLLFRTVVLLLLVPVVFAADPYFDPEPPSYFNLTQDLRFEYDLNATDPDGHTPFIFSNDAASRGWDVFYMNNLTGMMVFTPRNADVGVNEVIISVTDSNDELDSKLVRFNVSNVNDPPNITDFAPATDQPVIVENDSVGFEFDHNATDPDIPYGDTLTNQWIMDGVNITKNATWSFKPGFCEPSYRNITLVVWDSEGLSDRREWNVSIVNLNRDVILNRTISNITWSEDTNLLNNFSLHDYFYDTDYEECGDPLNFSFSGNQSVAINITGSNVSFYPEPNWFGTEIINFTAYDGYTYSTSNNILLNVTDVPDHPVIENISDQIAYSHAIFSYRVNATDPDNDTLTYYDNTSLFDINSEGLIQFTPSQSQPGNYSIMINVSDSVYNVYTTFNLTIYNNTRPNIESVNNITIEESSLFQMEINGSDPELDILTFWTNFSSMTNPASSDDDSATFEFTPDQDDVGYHRVRIFAEDTKGAVNYTDFYLNITDINNPPILESIFSPQVIKINETITMQLNATDSDYDALNFTHNATFPNFYMNETGFINFTVNTSDLGTYMVNITVYDVTPAPKHDSQSVVFEITYNRPPTIDPIGFQSSTEDQNFTLQINGSDPDYDTLTFFTNSSFFNITDGLINFTPTGEYEGLHNISVNVTDNDGLWANTTFILRVIGTNDPPYFNPPIETLSFWNNIYEDTELFVYVNASDEEENDINFSNDFLEGSELFNITKINRTQALINFTPLQSDTGNYSVNFTVDDGDMSSSVVVNFTVRSSNDAPVINRVYPYGLQNITIFNWTDKINVENGTRINATENNTIFFNHTSSDQDNLTLLYGWYFDGSLQANTTQWNCSLNFSTQGIHNITLVVSDGNLTDTMFWNISIENKNRPPVFGLADSDFSGTLYRVENSDGLRLSPNNSYYPSGYYTSDPIDLGIEFGFEITQAEWTGTIPNQTDVDFRYRYSTDSQNWEQWTNWTSLENPMQLGLEDYRYIQYMLNFTTNNTNVTPIVSSFDFRFDILNRTWPENQDVSEGTWIDLDKFFNDPDGDSLEYTVSGESNVDVRIENTTNYVGLYPVSVGTDNIIFRATDPYGYNTTSNSVEMVITEAEGQDPDTEYISSGGGTTTYVQVPVVVEKKEQHLVNLDIIAPGKVTTYVNGTVEVPITLENKGDNLLQNINLSATSNSSEMRMQFSDSLFRKLERDESVDTMLTLYAPDMAGNFDVIVKATVQDPEFEDSALISVSTIEKGQINKSQLNTKISFTRDLLMSNPECLELTEILEEAQAEINNTNYAAANNIIEETIMYCRYLMTEKEPFEESTSSTGWFGQIFGEETKSRVLMVAAGIVFVFLIIIVSLIVERIRNSR